MLGVQAIIPNGRPYIEFRDGGYIKTSKPIEATGIGCYGVTIWHEADGSVILAPYETVEWLKDDK